MGVEKGDACFLLCTLPEQHRNKRSERQKQALVGLDAAATAENEPFLFGGAN